MVRHSNTMWMYLVAAFLLIGCSISFAQEAYPDRYDGIDIDSILRNDRLVQRYTACLLDKGPCSPEGRSFRQILPEALATNCVKCTEGQKTIVRKVSRFMMKKDEKQWAQFVQKYDPERQYYASFQRFLSEG